MSERQKRMSWGITATKVVLSMNGKEVFAREVTEYPKPIQDYAMAIRFVAKLQDVCAKDKDNKLTDDECIASVKAMDTQLMNGSWNKGSSASPKAKEIIAQKDAEIAELKAQLAAALASKAETKGKK
jgi:hypothetical protein